MSRVRHLRTLTEEEAHGIARDSFMQAMGYVPESDLRRRCHVTALHQLAAFLDGAKS